MGALEKSLYPALSAAVAGLGSPAWSVTLYNTTHQGNIIELVAGALNKNWLSNHATRHTPECSEVRAAIAYASDDKLQLFEGCKTHSKPLTFYCRYDETVPVHPNVIKWFLDEANPNFTCRVVPDILHAKVIWWVGVGAYIGSANLTDRAWVSNIEAGTFLTEEEMEASSMLEKLRSFFDVVDSQAEAISKEFHEHLVQLSLLRTPIDNAQHQFSKSAKRFFDKKEPLTSVNKENADDKAYKLFARRWRESLQVLRDISTKVASPVYRPDWIPADTPAGAQADQFIHAYYYKFIQGNRGGQFVDAAFERNHLNREKALEEALKWWKQADFDHEQERRTLLTWAPRLKDSFSRERLRGLSKNEFSEAMSMVHAVLDYGRKRKNTELGLPESQQDADTKVRIHAEQLWEQRSEDGKSPLEVLEYVIWGPGEVEQRIWRAARSDAWRLRWMQFSTYGEIVGWARPNDFPPRNERTLKGLRGLGYAVRDV